MAMIWRGCEKGMFSIAWARDWVGLKRVYLCLDGIGQPLAS